jgi:hypothetical protein
MTIEEMRDKLSEWTEEHNRRVESYKICKAQADWAQKQMDDAWGLVASTYAELSRLRARIQSVEEGGLYR